MRNWRHAPAGLLLALILAGCGSAGSGGIYGNNPGNSTTNPTATTAATVTSAHDLPLNTAQVMVGGTAKTVLVSAGGFTLYYRTPDTASSVCSGGCAGAWPPILATSGSPTSTATLSGTLATLTDANGTQVTYNGHPLYRYSGDQKPGDATGNKIANIWFVATPDLALASTSSGPTPTPAPGYHYPER